MKKRFVTLLLCMFIAGAVFAQQPGTLPCDDADPTLSNTDCPLDTWVYVMMVITVVPALYYINKQKRQMN